MNINRHNYESFFLMYVDNELAAAEKNEVEIFIEQNPDLKPELELLQQSILKPESIVFKGKNSLLKEEPITETQQQLLMLLDNELNAEDKRHIQSLIKNDSSVFQEWNILQQTKAKADSSIIFENKELLYKRSSRIIAFDWRKIAVAAILIGFGLWGFISFYTKKDAIDTASNGATHQSINSNNTTQQSSTATSTQHSSTNNQKTIDTNYRKLQLETMAQNVSKKNTQKYSAATNDNANQIAYNNNQPDNKTTVDNSSAINLIDNSNKTETPNVSISKLDGKVATNDISANTKTDDKLKANSMMDNAASSVKNPYAAYTASTKDETEVSDDNQILYMPEKKIKKTKLGNFFSKVKSKTKKGIRIANLEFAIQ